MITTTLNRIRAHSPCESGWKKLLAGLGKTAADDEPLSFVRIVEINGLDDALWCCRAEPKQWKVWRLFAVWCGRQVQHLMTDTRSVAALDVAERHANGNATNAELNAAAWDAAWDAAAWDAVAATWDAAVAAARAAKAVVAVARAWGAAAGDAAVAAARDAQKSKFIEMVTEAGK